MTDDWQEVNSMTDETWDYNTDKEVIGVYIEKREGVGPNQSMMYTLQKADGTTIGCWGTSVLDGKMKAVEIGQELKIVYAGKKKSEKTGKPYHDFAVYHRAAPMKEV